MNTGNKKKEKLQNFLTFFLKMAFLTCFYILLNFQKIKTKKLNFNHAYNV